MTYRKNVKHIRFKSFLVIFFAILHAESNAQQIKIDTLAPVARAEKSKLYIPPFKQMPERFPKYPLKTKRMIYTDSDIIKARQNLIKYGEARKVKDSIVHAADRWLDWTDSDLRDLLTDARVPRAFDLNSKGSPVHGDLVFKKAGRYPWIVDPRHPFQVKSPIDGQMFPTNDYAVYYKTGFKDKKGWDSQYVDDGWGWVAPDGERYWFVAYANHWLWKDFIEPGLADLGRAYLLTGDKRYAHKAAIMLHRMAEVYPSMDHANQSRYGLMEKAKGHTYNGKVVNLIWETSLIQNAAEAYDAVWETIDNDEELQKFYGKTGVGVRSFIEANLLEDALDAYLDRKIQGNYGMHQSALIYILLARQNMDTEKYLHMIVEEPGESRVQTGIRYALYNMIFRDGQPLEAPHYNLLTVNKMATLSETLYKGGIDLFKEPRLKMLTNSPLDIVAIGKFTPDIGDTGSVLGELVGLDPDVYQITYPFYKNPSYLTWMATAGKTGASSFSTFESLFRDVLPQTKPLSDHRAVPIQSSRLLAGYGLGMLNNPKDKTALSYNYGFKGTHFHWDFLNFELFANGQKMMPDLGYPDAMNVYVKEIYTWSVNTVAHNTVVVDSQKQAENLPGKLHDFSHGSFARNMDASSPTYPQTTQYRRNLVMIDVDSAQSYVVDFFRVAGGKQHDYSLHGSPGTVTVIDGEWGEKQPGTFAGADVNVGQVYDDEKMGVKDYADSYADYSGSGFQYLFNVQPFKSGKTIVQYQHVLDKNAALRIHILPNQHQEIVMADAYDKPRAKNYLVKYMIARRKAADGKPLQSTFTGIMETYKEKPYIESTNLLKFKTGSGIAIEIKRKEVTDIVISDTTNVKKVLTEGLIETDATCAVVTFDLKGNLTRVFFSNGTYLKCKGKFFEAKAFSGTVTAVNNADQTLTIKPVAGSKAAKINFTGEIAYFSNKYRTTVHPIAGTAQVGTLMTLKTQDDLLVGRIRIKEVLKKSMTTETNLPFAPLYVGASVLDNQFKNIGILTQITGKELKLADNLLNAPEPEDDIWLSDIAVGDQVTVKPSFSWQR
jgi:hypothetical protein